jgi:hypothetical protein
VAKFLDYHAQLPQMPPEAGQQMAARIQAGQADEHGVRPLNVFIGSDGSGHCLTEAPSAEAVVQAHRSLGFELDHRDIREVTALV